MKYKLPALLLIVLFTAMKSDKNAYTLFNKEGKDIKYKKMMKDLPDADVIFFGELHNNAISHWLQYEISRDILLAKPGGLIMGAEMFESDNALLMQEYLSGNIREKDFESQARLWPNYKTDYRPLMRLARDSGLKFIATNIPRRYAALVNKQGFEGLQSLSEEAKKLIAPLPIEYEPELPAYKGMMEMMGGMGRHVNENLPKAQAIKDATMAHFIAENLEEGKTFIHFNGAYHSDNNQGIIWYLKQKHPDLNILSITTVEQSQLDSLKAENTGKADYIICVDEDVSKTH